MPQVKTLQPWAHRTRTCIPPGYVSQIDRNYRGIDAAELMDTTGRSSWPVGENLAITIGA